MKFGEKMVKSNSGYLRNDPISKEVKPINSFGLDHPSGKPINISTQMGDNRSSGFKGSGVISGTSGDPGLTTQWSRTACPRLTLCIEPGFCWVLLSRSVR